jgi:hypothetical protein
MDDDIERLREFRNLEGLPDFTRESRGWNEDERFALPVRFIININPGR